MQFFDVCHPLGAKLLKDSPTVFYIGKLHNLVAIDVDSGTDDVRGPWVWPPHGVFTTVNEATFILG